MNCVSVTYQLLLNYYWLGRTKSGGQTCSGQYRIHIEIQLIWWKCCPVELFHYTSMQMNKIIDNKHNLWAQQFKKDTSNSISAQYH